MTTASRPQAVTSVAAALLIGLGAAGVYLAFTVPNLGFHGAHYDELNKAVPAFAWAGRPSHMFSLCRIGDVPVMVMKYKAATEAFVYGGLRLATGSRFTIESWRAFSIGAVVAAILAFALLARWTLRWWALALGLLLLVLDTTITLGTRLNWGPVTLGLVERLLLIGIFLRGQRRSPASAWTAFALGAVTGFAIFDKLSAVVLVIPLLFLVTLDGAGNRIRRVLAAIAGGFVGALPLVLINLKWWWSYGILFSLGEVLGTHEHTADSLIRVVVGCASLGAGDGFATEMLDRTAPAWVCAAEGIGIAIALAAVLIAGSRAFRSGPSDERRAAILALSWLAVVLGLYFLPEVTHHHHWPLSVPFVPIAIALSLQGFAARAPDRTPVVRGAAIALMLATVLLLVARTTATTRVQHGLHETSYTRKWDPDVNALGRFAETSPKGTGFLAAGWGVATQIFCFSQGREDIVREIYWKEEGADRLGDALRNWNERDPVYLVALDPPQGPHTDITAQLFAAPPPSGWMEQRIDPQLGELDAIRCRKFTKASPSADGSPQSRPERAARPDSK